MTNSVRLLALRMPCYRRRYGSWKAEGGSFSSSSQEQHLKEKRKKTLKELIYQNFKEGNMLIAVPLKLLTLLHTTFSKPVETSYR